MAVDLRRTGHFPQVPVLRNGFRGGVFGGGDHVLIDGPHGNTLAKEHNVMGC